MLIALSAVRDASRLLFRSADRLEIVAVARTVRNARRLGLGDAAAAITRAGNGWLYAVISLSLLAARVEGSARFVFCSTIGILLTFVIYPPLKMVLSRTRPCDYDPSLSSGIEPLDRYSCPSGHTMTAAAYGVTMAYSWDLGLVAALLLLSAIGWSRVATGHHYLSDVVLGAALGVAVAAPVATILY